MKTTAGKTRTVPRRARMITIAVVRTTEDGVRYNEPLTQVCALNLPQALRIFYPLHHNPMYADGIFQGNTLTVSTPLGVEVYVALDA